MTSIGESYSYYWNSQYLKERSNWEIGRFIALYTAGPHSKKINRVEDICIFPWEENKNQLLTVEQQKQLIKSGKHPLVDKDGKRRN